MAGNTQKHNDFVGEPMEQKLVTALPGIGRAIGQRLIDDDRYGTARKLFGYYLNHTREQFIALLGELGNASKHNATLAYGALEEWAR